MPRIRMDVDEPPPDPPPLPECFPEMLSLIDLCETLQKSGILNTVGKTKEELLLIYHEQLYPKPQRTKTRSNRRGQQMQLNKIRLEQKKRKLNHDSFIGRGSSTAKHSKFTIAESTQNSRSGSDSKPNSSLNPSHSRLKPPPLARNGQTQAESESPVISKINHLKIAPSDPLAHVKINCGPKTLKIRPKSLTENVPDISKMDTIASPFVVTGKSQTKPTIDCKFWNMFGSISHELKVPLSVNKDLASKTPLTSSASKLDVAPRRILKLNRKTIVKHTPSTPVSVPSPSEPISASDSGSDMDTSESSSKKINKITWP
jgi:hypothetical protein